MKMLFFEVDEKQELYFKKAFPHDELYFYTNPLTAKTIPAHQADAQVISIFVHSHTTKTILDQFPKLALLLTRTTGFDHIDCVAAKERNICVYALPTYATQAVAEYTFALLLALLKKIVVACKKNEEHDYDLLQGTELAGKTIGIIGLGMIGTAVARIANGFSMKVIAYDPCCSSSEVPVSFVSLGDLLQQADVVSLHVPLNATTKHMLNRESMKQCKQGSYLINTARGGVIETAALIELLENNTLAGVALDVLEEEFFTHHILALLRSAESTGEECKVVMENMYLMQHPRVIISPHNAFNSTEALDRSMKETVERIEAWKKNRETIS